jgi:hypothetical protein
MTMRVTHLVSGTEVDRTFNLAVDLSICGLTSLLLARYFLAIHCIPETDNDGTVSDESRDRRPFVAGQPVASRLSA